MAVGVSTYSLTVALHNMSMNVYSYSVVGMVDNVILLAVTTERDNDWVTRLRLSYQLHSAQSHQ